MRHFCIAVRDSSSSTFKHFWGSICYLLRALHQYLTLAEFGKSLKLSHLNEWDKGCTDIMYMTIGYPNYPIISLLTQPRGICVYVMRLKNSRFHFGTWTRILTTVTQCDTIELRRPFTYMLYIIWMKKFLSCLHNHTSTWKYIWKLSWKKNDNVQWN